MTFWKLAPSKVMQFPNLVICKSTDLVARVQAIEASGKPVAGVISIEHPGAETPERGKAPCLAEILGASWQQKQLILTMWDVEQPHPQGPGAQHVRAALKHFDSLLPAGSDDVFIVQCRKGKARSTGTALALLRHRAGAGTEVAALTRLLQIAPEAAPNLLVVQHADAVIGCGGKLEAAVAAHPDITERRQRAEASRAAQIARGEFQDFEKLPQAPSGTRLKPDSLTP